MPARTVPGRTDARLLATSFQWPGGGRGVSAMPAASLRSGRGRRHGSAAPHGHDLNPDGSTNQNPAHVLTRYGYDALNRRTTVQMSENPDSSERVSRIRLPD